MKTVIAYEDVAPRAKQEPSEYTSTDKKEFVNLKDLKTIVPAVFPNYALCLPMYSKIGEFQNSPNELPKNGLGYVSASISDEMGTFSNNPIIEREFTYKHSSVGISVGFNRLTGDYCNKINIKWYEDGTLLSDMDFEPDSIYYFCQNNVENFNKIVIEFKGTSKPYRYVWVSSIDYGTSRVFEQNEAKKIQSLQEISQISEELTINTMDFELYSLSDVEFMFQKTQKMKLYTNDVLVGAFYIDTSKRKAANQYELKTKDAVGLLADVNYYGGMYENEPAAKVIGDILSVANLDYEIETTLENETVTGYLPIMSCRDALARVCLAIGAVADTSYSENVVIRALSNELKREITQANQYSGTNSEILSKVTGAVVTGYKYTKNSNVTDLYNETLDGTVTVQFNEPQHTLSIVGGTIQSSGTNYAIINGTGGTVKLTGQGYNVSVTNKSKTNPTIGVLDIQNNVTLEEVYLVNSKNIDSVLDRVYAYYLNNYRVNAKIILEDTNVRLGDKVRIETDFEGIKTGVIEKMKTYYSNSIASEVVIK